MKDEAVSPIVAFMLLLMIVVSFISILNAYYIPSLKQQAEIEHLKKVEEAFLMIDSDIHRLISFKDSGILKQRILLGGGDVLFSPVRSSGFLQISLEKELGEMQIGTDTFHFTIVNITYRPIGNFWINQGYYWGKGSVNVTKGDKKSTWLDLTKQDQANEVKQDFFNLLLQPSIEEKIVNLTTNTLENATITVSNMTMNPSNSYLSSNGFGDISLKNSKSGPKTFTNIGAITFVINDSLSEEKVWVKNSYNNISIFNDYYMTRMDEDDKVIFTFSPTINLTLIENSINVKLTQ